MTQNEYGAMKKKLQIRNLKNQNIEKKKIGQFRFLLNYFLLTIIVYILHEGYQLKLITEKFGLLRGYLIYIWSLENILDTCLVIISLFHVITIVYSEHALAQLVCDLIELKKYFDNLNTILQVEKSVQFQCNLMILIGFIKTLNLLKCNPKTYLITDTLRNSFVDLTFLVMFVLLNYAIYGIIGYAIFADDAQFESLEVSIKFCMLSIVRHFDFEFLLENNFFMLLSWQLVIWFYAQRTLVSFVISVLIAHFNKVRINHNLNATEKTFNRIVKNSLQYFGFKMEKNL